MWLAMKIYKVVGDLSECGGEQKNEATVMLFI